MTDDQPAPDEHPHKAIIDDLRAGYSWTRLAAAYGVGMALIRRLARENGVEQVRGGGKRRPARRES